jgi:hypothetical protein
MKKSHPSGPLKQPTAERDESDPLRILQQQANALSVAVGKVREAAHKARSGDLKAALAELSNCVRDISSWRLDEVALSLAGRTERDFLEIEARLREACDAKKWNLFGQWPKFYVERGIPVQFDEKSRRVTVSDQVVDGTSVEKILAALEPLVRDLIPRNFTGKKFVESLAEAYDDLRKSGASQLPILSVYKQLVLRQQRPRFWKDARADAFIGLSIDQFRARLSRAMDEGALTTGKGRELRLMPPLDPKDSIFVYQPAEQRFGYIGRMEFVDPSSAGAVS